MSPPAAPPPRAVFDSRDPDVAHEWLRSTYHDYRPRASRPVPGQRFRGAVTDLERFTVSRLRFQMAAEVHLPELNNLVVAQVMSGWYEFDLRGHQERAQEGQTLLVPASEDVVVDWDPLDVGALTVVPAEVYRIASETTGIDPAAVAFAGGRPVSADAEAHWLGMLSYVNRAVLPNPHAARSPLVLAEVSRLVGASMLATFENTSMTFEPVREAVPVTPASVRRAIAFIESQAHTELTLTEVAAAARVGPRALQSAFRRHLDITPLGYARRVRLDGAHRDLHAADPTRGDSVAAIAARWGFAHQGRFASTYRAAYGRTPGQTLRG